MKRTTLLKAFGILGCAVFTGLFAVYAQDSVEGWSLTMAKNGQVSSMEYENPNTYLKIQKYVRVDLDNQGNPTAGAVKFMNGLDRDMPKQEATWYWENFNGRHALWSFLSTKGKLVDIDPQAAPIPDNFYGKYTRAVTNNNVEFFGTLMKAAEGPDAFQLTIDGASGGPVHFDRKVVKQLQQIK
jgi:hypothetical protein